MSQGILEGVQKCTGCLKQLSEDQFNWRVQGKVRHRRCKTCTRAYGKNHYTNNKDYYKAKSKPPTRKHRYSITDDAWKVLKARFQGKCWVCRMEEATCVDHDHLCCPGRRSCGVCVRGALCHGCNSGMGLLKNSPEVLRAMADYLEGVVVD